MSDEELELARKNRDWYDAELSRVPENNYLKWARDELAKRIRDEEARRRREADQGRLF